MKPRFSGTVFFLILLLAMAPARAFSVGVGVRGGASASGYNLDNFTVAYGWTAGIKFFSKKPGLFHWNLGVLYSQISYAYSKQEADSYHLLRFPFSVSYRPRRWYSLAFGAYYGKGLGLVTYGNPQAKASFPNAFLESSQYGGLLGGSLYYRSLVFQLRGYLGISRADTVDPMLRHRSIELLAGFDF